VDYPIDVIYYKKDSFEIIEKRFKKDELMKYSKLWSKMLSESINKLPEDWMKRIFDKDVLEAEKNEEIELNLEE
jgi:putative proteasome-type protease